jgi:hypothetical protein
MKKTIFKGNRPTEEILIEAVFFGISVILISTFCAAIIILIINLLNY